MLVLDAGTEQILLANLQAQRLFHGAPIDLTGRTVRSCLGADVADYIDAQVAQAHLAPEAPLEESLATTAIGQRTLRSRAVRGSRPDGEGDYILVISRDVTEELAAYAQIHHMAQHDGLTDLPNRAFFQDRLETALAADRGNRSMTAILCLDLDNFKNVNDARATA